MKKLALVFLLAACSANNMSEYFSNGYYAADTDLDWYEECKYYITDNVVFENQKELFAKLKQHDCVFITDHNDFKTEPQHIVADYYNGYNKRVEEYVRGIND